MEGWVKVVNYWWRTVCLLYKTLFLKLCNALCRKQSKANKRLRRLPSGEERRKQEDRSVLLCSHLDLQPMLMVQCVTVLLPQGLKIGPKHISSFIYPALLFGHTGESRLWGTGSQGGGVHQGTGIGRGSWGGSGQPPCSQLSQLGELGAGCPGSGPVEFWVFPGMLSMTSTLWTPLGLLQPVRVFLSWPLLHHSSLPITPAPPCRTLHRHCLTSGGPLGPSPHPANAPQPPRAAVCHTGWCPRASRHRGTTSTVSHLKRPVESAPSILGGPSWCVFLVVKTEKNGSVLAMRKC